MKGLISKLTKRIKRQVPEAQFELSIYPDAENEKRQYLTIHISGVPISDVTLEKLEQIENELGETEAEIQITIDFR